MMTVPSLSRQIVLSHRKVDTQKIARGGARCAFQGNAEMVEVMLEHSTLQQLQHKDGSGSDAEGISQLMLQQALGTRTAFHTQLPTFAPLCSMQRAEVSLG